MEYVILISIIGIVAYLMKSYFLNSSISKAEQKDQMLQQEQIKTETQIDTIKTDIEKTKQEEQKRIDSKDIEEYWKKN